MAEMRTHLGKLCLEFNEVVHLREQVPASSAEQQDRLFHEIPVGADVPPVFGFGFVLRQVEPLFIHEGLAFEELDRVLRGVAFVGRHVNVHKTVHLFSAPKNSIIHIKIRIMGTDR
jgi:hypothetical protein